MRSDDGPRIRIEPAPSRNHPEDTAIAAIDQQRRFQSFLCLLLWQFGRDNKRKRKLLAVLRELTGGTRLGDPGSVMDGASKDALDQVRARLLRALEKAALNLAQEQWTPEVQRRDFRRFAEVVHACRRKQRERINSEELLDGLAGVIAEIRESLVARRHALGKGCL